MLQHVHGLPWLKSSVPTQAVPVSSRLRSSWLNAPSSSRPSTTKSTRHRSPLQRISREINTFALLLRQIDGIRVEHDSGDDAALADSIEMCTESTGETLEATQQLEAIMRRFSVGGRIYSALKSREVNQLCTDLERSKNTLMLAFEALQFRTQVTMMNALRDPIMQQLLMQLKYS
ncbi:hypothetical protein LTR37_019318 [Vermiconidia calcicola]|uniref:Uncharacterized protein n=1 Tax=Vermiconidia calcicola TaxID=1690605 RepID=A0ACC3MG99_9PEZI|nr:hypothetical protein LTR37_019318 [Vermiconidia calcicola]